MNIPTDHATNVNDTPTPDALNGVVHHDEDQRATSASMPAATLAAPHQDDRHHRFHSGDQPPDSEPLHGRSTRTGDQPLPRDRNTRVGMGMLLGLAGLGVAAILLAPVALSSRDLLDWAASPSGLDLPGHWPVLVILALDAAAVACVLMSVLCTWRGEKPGVFGFLVWVFAITSAFANWRHGMAPHAPADRFWFIPLMSLTGPGVLEVVLRRARLWIVRDSHNSRGARPGGHQPYEQHAVWQRWIPGMGSFTDTFGAYRTRLLVPGISNLEEAVIAYRRLCPDGSLRVADALRRQHQALAQTHLITLLTSGTDTRQNPSRTATGKAQLPVDLMKRIPVQDEPYQRWLTAWADLREIEGHDGTQVRQVADRHGFSTRQIGFIRRAGEAGLLESAIPPAVRMAQAARHPADNA